MKYFLCGMYVFLLPSLTFAACIGNGYSVVFVNGVFDDEKEALQEKANLEKKLSRDFNGESVTVHLGYNPTHLAGAGDLIQAAAQTMDSSISGYDLDAILLQLYPEITTRKILLVGHSQGAFYANDMYDYLLAHGEPKQAVGVYEVATPASSVAGGGRHLTSSNDRVINTAREIAADAPNGLLPLVAAGTVSRTPLPLPANIALSDGGGNGHGFSRVYLAQAPERVVGDIQKALLNLKPVSASDHGDCFTPPSGSLGYQTQKVVFAVADTAAAGIKTGLGVAQTAATAASGVLGAAVAGAFGLAQKVAADIGVTIGGVAGLSHAVEPQSSATNFDIFKRIYGSRLIGQEYKELLGQQGSAVATAASVASPASKTVVFSVTKTPDGTMPVLVGSGTNKSHTSGSSSELGVSGGVYAGVVGSSTLLFKLHDPSDISALSESGYALTTEPVFVAILQEPDALGHSSFFHFNSYLTEGDPQPLQQNFVIFPWLSEAEE